tara:strand:- start:1842 stop:2288 length:447 start_codon:yes stop_codon:yes gene_type:complete
MNENFDYPQDYDVYWEKWVDAYEQDLQEEQDLIEQLKSMEFEFSEEEEILYEELAEEGMQGFKSIKTIMTPFGMMPLTEQSLASNYFKFWTGHTNFKLLKSHIDTIGMVEGVETIDVLTPYRFRIAVAKLFIDRNVMSDVRSCLLKTL